MADDYFESLKRSGKPETPTDDTERRILSLQKQITKDTNELRVLDVQNKKHWTTETKQRYSFLQKRHAQYSKELSCLI